MILQAKKGYTFTQIQYSELAAMLIRMGYTVRMKRRKEGSQVIWHVEVEDSDSTGEPAAISR